MAIPPLTGRGVPEHLSSSAPETTRRSRPARFGRLAPLVALIAIAGVIVAMGWHQYLSLEALVRHRASLDAWIADHYFAALAAYLLVYVGVVALSLPGAAALTIAGGVLFGFIVAGIAVVFAATIGATLIFLLARSAAGEFFLRRAGPRVAKVVEGFRSEAFSYLLFLRLVPVFPFVLVNLAAALAAIPLSTFVVATALGIIPGTFVFASIGAGLDSVIAAQAYKYKECVEGGGAACKLDFDIAQALTPELLGALTALGVLALAPIFVKRWYARRGRNDGHDPAPGGPAGGT
jgi:uncharacterized membrane protein YdjX (TVP38/TMEM64 family)